MFTKTTSIVLYAVLAGSGSAEQTSTVIARQDVNAPSAESRADPCRNRDDRFRGFHLGVAGSAGRSKRLGWGISGNLLFGSWCDDIDWFLYDGLFIQAEKAVKGYRLSVGRRVGNAVEAHYLPGWGASVGVTFLWVEDGHRPREEGAQARSVLFGPEVQLTIPINIKLAALFSLQRDSTSNQGVFRGFTVGWEIWF